MLEKIGLPAKPSLRSTNWVLDASHCQGCSSQFTFINRKHHCRRCGGLFCNSCTQHRMVLRGQGDSPVRICGPCKQLEEAAHFEMRHGHRSRAGRGGLSLKPTLKDEDEILSQILGEDKMHSFPSTEESGISAVSVIQKVVTSASCSNIQETSSQDGGEILRSLSVDEPKHVMGELGSASPEELHQQAVEEKKNYKILKAEGKAEEALKAFKRGKELERQAGALEILVRKNRRKASNKLEVQKAKDIPKESGRKDKFSPQLGKEKDDVFAELKELGWSDVDFYHGDKKSASLSLEGELSTLIGEFSQKKDTNNITHGIHKTEVVALKKKALKLKREGKLTEAKEELKRAKVLEKQLEEQDFFAGVEDSDDEISLLIRSMDVDKQDNPSVVHDPEPSFDFNHLVGVAGDLGVENFDVTDEDMNDPEIATALRSLGWADVSNQPNEVVLPQLAAIDREAVLGKIQSLKGEAVNQKRAGNAAEAMRLRKNAKQLERDLESSASKGNSSIVENAELLQKNSRSLRSNMVEDVSDKIEDLDPKLGKKSKLMIQKELLDLKKKALAWRREGRLDEAEEELKKGKVLEQRLEEMDKTSNVKFIPSNISNDTHLDISSSMGVSNDGEEGDVTDLDMHDPTYLSVLKNLGWEDDNEILSFPSKVPTQRVTSSAAQAPSSTRSGTSRRTKAEIHRELLGLKRNALVLRRQGDTDGAEEILEMAKALEAEIAEIEEPKKDIMVEYQNKDDETTFVKSASDEGSASDLVGKNMHDKAILSLQKNSSQMDEEVESAEEISAKGFVSRDNQSSLQQEILVHKRKAVSLKREGKLADARDELRQAKLLEKSLEERNAHPSTSSSDASISTSNVAISGKKELNSSNLASRPLSARDRFKLQQESLGHKRQALKLLREGRMEEARSEFELAKALETRLEESTAHDMMKPSGEPVDDLGVEDFLDPQLLSSLKALGLDNADVGSQGSKRPEARKHNIGNGRSEDSSLESAKLEELIKVEKVKAVSLKRSGKQAEALAALRQAKLLEKKLNPLAS